MTLTGRGKNCAIAQRSPAPPSPSGTGVETPRRPARRAVTDEKHCRISLAGEPTESVSLQGRLRRHGAVARHRSDRNGRAGNVRSRRG